MSIKKPIRRSRPNSSNRSHSSYARQRSNSVIIRRTRRHHYRRQQKKKLFTYIWVSSAILIFCIILAIIFIPAKENVLPVDAPQISSVLDTSSIEDSSVLQSSLISSIVDEEYQRAYETAAQIKLVNFDHPNYDDPDNLVSLDSLLSDAVTINSGANQLAEPAALALKEMFDAAEAEGITTYIVNSAYRDRATQQSFWDNRIAQDPSYGDDVYSNPVKTVPATASEHCTGLAVDILCDSVPHGTSDYKDTQEAKWLADNAYRFGFILRYPDEKQSITGVMFEPWHYRYVGKDAAADIYASGLCLEEYLASFGLPEKSSLS